MTFHVKLYLDQNLNLKKYEFIRVYNRTRYLILLDSANYNVV